MRKKTIAILGIIILALVLGFLFLSQRMNLQDFNIPMPGQQGGNNPTAPSEETPVIDPLKERIQAMTLEEKVGQLVMVGVDGYEINANAQQLIQNYH
ncbi:MAG TPA: beta-N-acetylhexosaminidase, partial [Desulfitobacterium dehalogenans]|nr:beta-N-acetylhexosaminidase [Desulfitobacterium dehalogenans]